MPDPKPRPWRRAAKTEITQDMQPPPPSQAWTVKACRLWKTASTQYKHLPKAQTIKKKMQTEKEGKPRCSVKATAMQDTLWAQDHKNGKTVKDTETSATP